MWAGFIVFVLAMLAVDIFARWQKCTQGVGQRGLGLVHRLGEPGAGSTPACGGIWT